MTTGSQNIAAGLGLSLVLANMLNGPQRPALKGFITGPTGSGGGGGGNKGFGHGGGLLGPYPLNPLIPDVPGVPQGPLSGIPFSPISLHTVAASSGSVSPWTALLEVAGELGFVAILVVLAEDYPAPVIVFLTILWLIFLAVTPHPWRSHAASAPAGLHIRGA